MYTFAGRGGQAVPAAELDANFREVSGQTYFTPALFAAACAAGTVPTAWAWVRTSDDPVTGQAGATWSRAATLPSNPALPALCVIAEGSHWWVLDVPIVYATMLTPLLPDMQPAIKAAWEYAAYTGAWAEGLQQSLPILDNLADPAGKAPVIAGYALRGGGWVIDASQMPANKQYPISGPSVFIFPQGNLPLPIGNLIADATWRGYTVPMAPADVQTLNRGDLVGLWSNWNMTSNPSNLAQAFMKAHVSTVDKITGVVTLRERIEIYYFTVAQGARLVKLDNKTSFQMELKVIGAGEGRNQRAGTTKWTYNDALSLHSVDCERGGWGFNYCVDWRVKDFRFEGATNSQQGYALSNGGSFGGEFDILDCSRARHVLTTNPGDGSYPWMSGKVSGLMIFNREAVGGSLDTHPGSDVISVRFIYHSNAPDADGSSGDPIFSQGAGLVVGGYYIPTSIARGCRFQSYGWRQDPDFVPTAIIGPGIMGYVSGNAFEVHNLSDRTGTSGINQLCRMQITGPETVGIGCCVNAFPETGPVEMTVIGGKMRTTGDQAVALEGDYGFPSTVTITGANIRSNATTRTTLAVEDALGYLRLNNCTVTSASIKVVGAIGGGCDLFDVTRNTPSNPQYNVGFDGVTLGTIRAYDIPFTSIANGST